MMRHEVVSAIEAAQSLGSGESGYGYCDPSAIVQVASPQELGRLLTEVGEGLKLRVPRDMIDATVEHEGQHGYAAGLLGATAVDYALRFVQGRTPRSYGDGLYFYPVTSAHFPTKVPRLVDAAIAAYPSSLHEGDVAAIKNLGFTDSQEVADQIRESNAGAR
jgi:hypothetical protein